VTEVARSVIAVASGKGGTGKTTVAAHLALASARYRKTLLVDLDVEAPDARGHGLGIPVDVVFNKDGFGKADVAEFCACIRMEKAEAGRTFVEVMASLLFERGDLS